MKKKQARLPDGADFYYLNRLELDFMYKEIFESDAYSNELVQFNDGDTIIDIGANIGLFIHFVTRRCKDVTFYAFEPVPRVFRTLEWNFEQSNGHQFNLFNCGVARESGEATFTVLKHCTARSTMHPEYSPTVDSVEGKAREEEFMLLTFKELPNPVIRTVIAILPPFVRRWLARRVVNYHGRSKQITCELKTVSQVIDENDIEKIDLLKVDAENSEVEILKGIRDEHWPRIRQLIIEVHPVAAGEQGADEPLEAVLQLMEEHGFETSVPYDKTLHPAPTVFARQTQSTSQ